MKKKGFTLIELLAVIVILAIIALIATPMIMDVIERAKKEAVKDTVYGYIDAIEKSIIVNNMMESGESFNNMTCNLLENNIVCPNNLAVKIQIKGDKLDSLSISFAENGTLEFAKFRKNQYCGNYTKNQEIKFIPCDLKIDASGVSFTPKDESWNVSNVEEALNDLHSR